MLFLPAENDFAGKDQEISLELLKEVKASMSA
jgi:hypothetical protein